MIYDCVSRCVCCCFVTAKGKDLLQGHDYLQSLWVASRKQLTQLCRTGSCAGHVTLILVSALSTSFKMQNWLLSVQCMLCWLSALEILFFFATQLIKLPAVGNKQLPNFAIPVLSPCTSTTAPSDVILSSEFTFPQGSWTLAADRHGLSGAAIQFVTCCQQYPVKVHWLIAKILRRRSQVIRIDQELTQFLHTGITRMSSQLKRLCAAFLPPPGSVFWLLRPWISLDSSCGNHLPFLPVEAIIFLKLINYPWFQIAVEVLTQDMKTWCETFDLWRVLRGMPRSFYCATFAAAGETTFERTKHNWASVSFPSADALNPTHFLFQSVGSSVNLRDSCAFSECVWSAQ